MRSHPDARNYITAGSSLRRDWRVPTHWFRKELWLLCISDNIAVGVLATY